MVLRMIVGLVLTVVAFAIAGRRLWWLKRLAFSGQPAPERVAAVREHPGRDVESQATEVIGQRKLLKWSVPGAAHAATFWGFIVLLLTIIEAYGDLFSRTFAIPGIGHWAFIGFIEDLFAVGVLAGIITFTVIRLRNNPHTEGRRSRFFGSHTRAAWVVLGMIFLVIATLLLYRGAQINTGVFPYAHGAFASQIVGHWLHPLGTGVNSVLEAVFLLGQIAVVMAFAVIVVYSKHLHIALAPLNVMFSRRPNALGPLEPMRSQREGARLRGGRPGHRRVRPGEDRGLHLEGPAGHGDLHRVRAVPVPVPGLGHRQAAVPQAGHPGPARPRLRQGAVPAGGLRRGAGEAAGRGQGRGGAAAGRRGGRNGVIDPDVLWSCTNCGACVEECPVDIEHIDHIDGMRRYQVLIESAFPVEAAGMLRNLENKGDPWGMGGNRRGDWITELDFEVPVVDGKIDPEIEYLFWVGCAGALEDRARKTTKAIATLLHHAGVKFAVLGPAETCTGDPARRIGQRVRLLDAGPAEHRDAERGRAGQGPGRRSWRPARTASTPSPASTRSSAGTTRSSTTPSCWPAWSSEGKLTPGRGDRGEADLPRPVLPGPAQQGLHPAPGDPRGRPRRPGRGDAPVQGPRLLLRRRRRPDVDGRADRQADQHRADRRGPGPGPGHHLHRLPVLPGHARRRRCREEELRRGQGDPRGRRRGPAAGPVRSRCPARSAARPIGSATAGGW